jgi:hypothetical protein
MAMSFHLLVRSSARGDRNRCGYCRRMTAELSPVTWWATGMTIYLEKDSTKLYDPTKGGIALSEVKRIPL